MTGLCERLNWRYLPDELDELNEMGEIDVGALMRDLELLDLYRDLQKPIKELSADQNERVGWALQLELDYGR